LRAHAKRSRKLKNKVLMGGGSLNPAPSKFYFGETKGDSEEDIEDLDEE